MSIPQVSIIIPCHNNANFLTESINSVLEQDYPNFEVIVIDDGSTDNSVELLKKFGNKIKLIQQENQGPAAARNAGLKAAKGEYIAFNDSDDLWLQGKLSAQINFMLKNPDISVCYSGWANWDGNNISTGEKLKLIDAAPALTKKSPEQEGWMYFDLLKESVIHTITAVIHRGVVDSVGMFDTAYRIGEDHDFWIRVSRKHKIKKIDKVYALYRNNPNSITKKVQDKNYSLLVLEDALQRYGRTGPCGECLAQHTLNNYLASRHFGYGYNAMLSGMPDKAKMSFQACLRYQYKLPKVLAFWLICTLPPVYKLFLKRKRATKIEYKS